MDCQAAAGKHRQNSGYKFIFYTILPTTHNIGLTVAII